MSPSCTPFDLAHDTPERARSLSFFATAFRGERHPADELTAELGSFGQDQIGALGPVLNALVLCNTRYLDTAVNRPRADGFDVRDEDVRDEDIARLSPYVRPHINVLGRYSFRLPDLADGLRLLRDPDAADEE